MGENHWIAESTYRNWKRTFLLNRGRSTSKFQQAWLTEIRRGKKKHAKICDSMPTSKGEGRIRENLKCAVKQAASARAVPETNRFYSSLLQDQKRGKREILEALLTSGLCLHATDLLLLQALRMEKGGATLTLEKKVVYHNNIVLQPCPQSGCSGIYKPSTQIDSNELLTRGCQQSC